MTQNEQDARVPKRARMGALMDVLKGVQRSVMPRAQAQTGDRKRVQNAKASKRAPSTGHRNARAPKPWTQNRTDARMLA